MTVDVGGDALGQLVEGAHLEKGREGEEGEIDREIEKGVRKKRFHDHHHQQQKAKPLTSCCIVLPAKRASAVPFTLSLVKLSF